MMVPDQLGRAVDRNRVLDKTQVMIARCFGAALQLRYANNSNYKNDTMIRKEVFVSKMVLQELKRIIQESEILKEDDGNWPEPDRVGRQELEVIVGTEHISFATTKLGSMLQVTESRDPDGLRNFYYLVQDLKTMVISLMNAHFKINPYS